MDAIPVRNHLANATDVRFVSATDPAERHTVTINNLGTEFDWWCSCLLSNGSEKASFKDAEDDALRVHADHGEPITRPSAQAGGA